MFLEGWLFDWKTGMDTITEIAAAGKLSKRKLSVKSELSFLEISLFGVPDLENR